MASIGDLDGNGSDDYAASGDSVTADQSGVVIANLVGRVLTETTTTVSPERVVSGGTAEITAAVDPARGGEITRGTVAFSIVGKPLGACQEVPVVEGVATCRLRPGVIGDRTVGAVYSGSTTHQYSVARTSALVVSPVPTTTSITAPSTAERTRRVPVTVEVDAARGTPRGRVEIRHNWTVIRSGWLRDGRWSGTVEVPDSVWRTMTLSARYRGALSHDGSVSSQVRVTVR